MSKHEELDTVDHHKVGYVQSGDPGAIGTGKVWVDTSGGVGNWLLKIRNAADTGWESQPGASGAGLFDAVFHSRGYYSAAAGGTDKIEWQDDVKKDTGFTHDEVTANDEITLDDAAWYLIMIDLGVEANGSEGDITVSFLLEYDDGGGWDDDSVSAVATVPAGVEDGQGNMMAMFQTTGADWDIRIEVENDSGASYLISTDNDYTRITILRFAG